MGNIIKKYFYNNVDKIVTNKIIRFVKQINAGLN